MFHNGSVNIQLHRTSSNYLKYKQQAVSVDPYKFSFYPTSTKLWNNKPLTPSHIAACQSPDDFKTFKSLLCDIIDFDSFKLLIVQRR